MHFLLADQKCRTCTHLHSHFEEMYQKCPVAGYYSEPCYYILYIPSALCSPPPPPREMLALNVYLAMCYHKLDYYDVSQEVLAGYVQQNPDSAIAINLKACNYYKLYNGKAAEVRNHLGCRPRIFNLRSTYEISTVELLNVDTLKSGHPV